LAFGVGNPGAAGIDAAVRRLRPRFENFATSAGTADGCSGDLVSVRHRIEIGTLVWTNSPNATQLIAAFGYVIAHTLPDLGNPLFVDTPRAYAGFHRLVSDVLTGDPASSLVSFTHLFLLWLSQNKNPMTAAGIVAAAKNTITNESSAAIPATI
jgi:hypothetical protein